jgi:hypothetical protein
MRLTNHRKKSVIGLTRSADRSTVRSAVMAAAVMATLLAPLSWAGQLYRFANAQGGVVIGSTVPNDMVRNGYQVIDSATGRVLRTVAAQLTPKQAILKAAREERYSQCRDSQRRVNSLYETNEDIDHAEKQALASIETRIINAQASLTQMRNQELDLEDQAARLERSGYGVTAILVDSIAQAQAQIQNLELETLGRRIEQDEARKQFDRDREVFVQGDCGEIAKQITLNSLEREAQSQQKQITRRQWLDYPVAE